MRRRVGDGAELACELAGPGTGTPVVLIHGGLVSSAAWAEQVPFLALRHRVLTYDIRGYGGSRGGAGRDQSICRCALDCAELVERLDLAPAHLVGFSLGGMVALAAAGRRPDLARSLTLVSTTARLTADQAAGFRRRAEAVDADGIGAEVEIHLARSFSERFAAAHPERLGHHRELVRANDLRAVSASFRALAATDLTSIMRGVRCPVLVVGGEKDAAMPAAVHASALAAGIPGSRLEVIPGAGHNVQVEAPDAFNWLLAGFLAESDAA